MRILIVSDIHANPWALAAVERDAGAVDYVLCLGDIVNYGTHPREAIAWMRQHEAIVVRGNHDHAVAFAAEPHASPAKAHLATVLRDWTRSRLDPEELKWLARLPVKIGWEIAGTRFFMVHATPYDPLYDYRLTPTVRDDLLDVLIAGTHAHMLLVGHTHLPLIRRHRQVAIVNPGSTGQPLDGDPRAAYAIWEDGRIELCRVPYDQAELLESIDTLPLTDELQRDLRNTIRYGRLI